MRKLTISIILLILLFAGILYASTASIWYVGGDRVVTWDATTTLADGGPIPLGDIITYNVYYITRYQPGSAATLMGNTANTLYPLSWIAENEYYIGVATVRLPDGESETIESSISWSVNPGMCLNQVTFGIRYYLSGRQPSGLDYS